MPIDEPLQIARRCLVSGRVQGVWFRASTRDQAIALGLDGQAINLPDGRVEVIMVGERQAVEQLCQWLGRGPDRARVDGLECEEISAWNGSGFSIR